VSPSPPPSPSSPQAAATAAPWLLAAAVASLICGILSLLFLGACSISFLPSGWSFAPSAAFRLFPFSGITSVACGVIGIVLGHVARTRRAAPGSNDAALATAGLVLSYGGTLLCLALYALLVISLTRAGPFPPGN
jgi:hypothetical protein